MANEEHLKLLKQDVDRWNGWREEPPYKRPDLRAANLSRANLSRANLSGANLSGADLSGTILSGATLYKTTFGITNLCGVYGLEDCVHRGPSTIDHRTVERSGSLPLAFLRGCGLPDSLINYLPSLLNEPIQYYSCFISYSSKDEDFAKRIHADLQDAGVRCWFADEDLKIGDPLHDTIDTAIRRRDKLMLLLSETSVASAWVEREVRTALEEESKKDRPVIFPLRLDDAVMNTTDQWAHDIRRNRHVGDFTNWKDHDAYQNSFQRLLRNLKVAKGGGE